HLQASSFKRRADGYPAAAREWGVECGIRLLGAAGSGTTASLRGRLAVCNVPLPAGSVLAALHRQEEFVVGLGIFQAVEQEFNSSDFIHGMQDLAQNPHALQLAIAGQQFVATGAGQVDADGSEEKLTRKLASQLDHQVTCTLAYMEKDCIHSPPSI